MSRRKWLRIYFFSQKNGSKVRATPRKRLKICFIAKWLKIYILQTNDSEPVSSRTKWLQIQYFWQTNGSKSVFSQKLISAFRFSRRKTVHYLYLFAKNRLQKKSFKIYLFSQKIAQNLVHLVEKRLKIGFLPKWLRIYT